jgi:hypothetical protein
MRPWPTVAVFLVASLTAAPLLACGDEAPSDAVLNVRALIEEASRFDALARASDAAAIRADRDAARASEGAASLRREARFAESAVRFDLLSRAELLDARAATARAHALELRGQSRRARQEAAELRRQVGRPATVPTQRVI